MFDFSKKSDFEKTHFIMMFKDIKIILERMCEIHCNFGAMRRSGKTDREVFDMIEGKQIKLDDITAEWFTERVLRELWYSTKEYGVYSFRLGSFPHSGQTRSGLFQLFGSEDVYYKEDDSGIYIRVHHEVKLARIVQSLRTYLNHYASADKTLVYLDWIISRVDSTVRTEAFHKYAQKARAELIKLLEDQGNSNKTT